MLQPKRLGTFDLLFLLLAKYLLYYNNIPIKPNNIPNTIISIKR